MLIWSGWGITVVVFAALGLLATFGAADVLQEWLPYGPAGSLGFLIGGAAAALSIHLVVSWRERGQARAFIDEATGERIEVHPSAGSFFFIPTRFWTWIVLALFLAVAALQFDAVPLHNR
jgi:hypothetical protein